MYDDLDWRPARPAVGAPALESLIGGLSHLEIAPVGTDDLATRLRQIVATTRHATDATFATLHLCEPLSLERLPTAESAVPWTLCEGPPHLEHHAGLEQVLRTTAPVHLAVAAHRPTAAGGANGSATPVSVAAVPVLGAGGGVVGTLAALCEEAAPDASSLPPTVLPLLEALAAQAAGAVANARLAARLREAQFETVFRLSVAAEYRDPDTARHIQRMSRYSAVIAKHLGLPADEVELTRFASPMHDVGKLGIPDAILMKTGPLTEDEWRVMRMHTRIGADILGQSDSPVVRASEQVAATHHERFGGGGYPLDLHGDQIPLIGRIASLADAFDAITSRRCYKDALPLESGLVAAKADSGSHFDPACVHALEAGFDEVVRVHEHFPDPL